MASRRRARLSAIAAPAAAASLEAISRSRTPTSPFAAEEEDGRGDPREATAIYGSASGLSAAGNQFWHQGSPDILGTPNAFDSFGSALAASAISTLRSSATVLA